jgi:hypothetical protein
MERGDRHGPRLDEALAHETEGLVRSGHGTRAEEWRDPEPSGEDQPDADRAPDTTLAGGTPEGMTEADVEGRSELAQSLAGVSWPADRAALEQAARDNQAPERVLQRLGGLPGSGAYANVAEVWAAAGGGSEQERF